MRLPVMFRRSGRRPLFLLATLPWLVSCDTPTEAVARPPVQEVPPHTHDASAVVSGWFDDARFSPTIRIIDRDTVRFAGVVGWGGGPILESSGFTLELERTRSRLDSLAEAFTAYRSHEHDAADITSGTLPDTRLSANVALLQAPALRFGGALSWGGGPLLASSAGLAGGGGGGGSSDLLSSPNVFTAPQTFFHRLMVAKLTGDPTEGSGTIGLRFERDRDTELSPLGITWTMSGAERWAMGMDEAADDHPDFVILYNTEVGDIFRVADGAHFQMGAGVGPTPTEHLLFLNDRPGSGNENILNLQAGGDAERFIRTLDPETGVVPFAVGTTGAVGIGRDYPDQTGLMLDVAGAARSESWETLSDRGLKEDIRPVGSVLERLVRLQAVQFRWKESGREDIGVIAQEVEALFPELVTTRDGVKSVDYSGLTAVLLAAVTELAGRCAEHGADHTH